MRAIILKLRNVLSGNPDKTTLVYDEPCKSPKMLHLTLCLLFSITVTPLALDTSNIVIVVLSQHESYNAARAQLLKEEIIEQTSNSEQNPPRIILAHEEHLNGSWTFFPLIPLLFHGYSDAEWFFFCLDNTAIKLRNLLTLLGTFEASKEYWLGHALHDKEPTIIHHFNQQPKKLKYPNIISGFAVSKSLLQSLNHRIDTQGLPETSFNIDASYELATYIYNGGRGTRLTHVPEFCGFFTISCATYPKGSYACIDSVSRDDIYVAVKTHDGNYGDRIPIIMKTWVKHVRNFGFFSNVEDAQLPNVIVVPDTKEGHCAKTYAILQHADSILKAKGIDWLIVVDDDTIISVARLTRLLSCYNPKYPIALGERYGFRAFHKNGYEYLTGGAGVILSAPLVRLILESSGCICPMSTTPDDMFIFGVCLSRIGIRPTHSPLFHQARPSDYSMDYLISQEPVSFHKFWMIDAVQVYKQWFEDADSKLQSTLDHTEL